jgi:hypothetical protein
MQKLLGLKLSEGTEGGARTYKELIMLVNQALSQSLRPSSQNENRFPSLKTKNSFGGAE